MVINEETIFALSSGAGRSGIAVIRLSGPDALECVSCLTGMKDLPARKAMRATFRDSVTGEKLDDGLVLTFPGPNSFTGEDVAELHLLGSRAVLDDVMVVLSKQRGIRTAEAGEFSRRAFDNGKLDLTAVEGLSDLINAETTAQRRQAQRQLSGELAALYDNWRNQLLEAIALFETEIDFSDEELPSDILQRVDALVCGLEAEIRDHLAESERGRRVRDGFYIVVLGAPNAGKSSFVNRLACRDVAIVSEAAGTTRDVVEIHLDLGGYPVIIADTAGLRGNVEEIEAEGVRRAMDRAVSADFRMLLFDGTLLPELDIETAKFAREPDTLCVVTKLDLMENQFKLPDAIRDAAMVSSKTEAGLAGLIERIRIEVDKRCTASAAPALTRARHFLALQDCMASLSCYQGATEVELAAEDLRLAARALGKITGRVDVEDVLDIIFKEFCIGK